MSRAEAMGDVSTDPDVVGAPPGQLRRTLGWSFANTLLSRLGTLVVGMALARMLDPRDFGQYTVALVALLLLTNINDIGMGMTIIRWPGDVRSIAPTAMTLTAAFSAALYAMLVVLAPVFASALGASSSVGVIRLMAVGVLIDGAFVVPAALVTRYFRQDRRLVADIAGLVVSSAVTVFLASRGHGAASLAWGRIAGNATSGGLLFVFSPVRVRPGFRTDVARQLLAGGLPLAGTTLVGVAVLNVDYLIVGRALGPIALGFYLMAFNLASWPVSVFSFTIQRVSVAGFGQLQHDPPALRAAFARSLLALVAVTTPVWVLLSALGLPLVRVLYGARWAPAADALRYLALLGGIRVGVELASDLLVALGKGRTTLTLQLLWLIALVPALSVGAALGGISGVGIAHVLVATSVVVPAFGWALRRGKLGLGWLLAPLAFVLAGAASCAAVVQLVLWLVVADLPRLAFGAVLGLLGYAIVVFPLVRTYRTRFADEGG